MKTKNGKIIGFLAVALGFCWACEDTADLTSSGSGGTRTRVSLMPGSIEGLRAAAGANTTLADSLHTKQGTTFDTGDTIGFFSDGGDTRDGKDGTEGFSNLKLGYDGATFNSDEFVRDLGQLGGYFGYYPYKPGIETEAGVSVYADSMPGHEKVIDFLTTNYAGEGTDLVSGGGVANHFYHTFAVVRVKLGPGFEDFDKEKGKIFLQLKRKVSAVRIDWKGRTFEDSPFTAVKLNYDDNAVSAEERRLPTYKTTDGDDMVWDVIVPCIPIMWRDTGNIEAGGVTVDAIVLNPGESGEVKIPVNNYEVFQGTLADGTVTHGVRGGFIYTAVIRKVGLDIGVFPYDVEEWKEENLDETLTAGISSTGDYQSFVNTCNSLFGEDRDYTGEEIRNIVSGSEELQKYGTDADGVFTIFLTADLDFSSVEMNSGSLTNLVIPFDGRGHTISNIRMTGGFCGTLRSTLKSLIVEGIRVIQPQESTDPVGLLADKMENNARIEQCSVVNGWLEGNGEVGAAVGTMAGGTVTGCTFSGIMIGTSDGTHQNLVGKYESGAIDDNNRNDMIIEQPE